jgi:hypothetical protein
MTDAEKLLVAAIVLAGMGALMSFAAAREIIFARQLDREGVIAIATVAARADYTRRKIIKYSFVVGGVAYTAGDSLGRSNLWETLPKSRWSDASVGSELPVKYLPQRPQISTPAEGRSNLPDDVTCLAIGVILFGGALGLLYKRRSASRDF